MLKIAAANEGPVAAETATIMLLIPIPRPNCARGKMKRTSAVFTLINPAAPKP